MRGALFDALSEPKPDLIVRACEAGVGAPTVQIVAALDGRRLDIRATRRLDRPPFGLLTFPLVGAFLFLCVSVTALSAWAVRRVGDIGLPLARSVGEG